METNSTAAAPPTQSRAQGADSPASRPLRITMLLENNRYPTDARVRHEAEALTRAGHQVRVIAPGGTTQARREVVNGVKVERYPMQVQHSGSRKRFLLEYLIAHAQLYWRGLGALVRGTDVVHAHNPPDTMFPLGILARAAGGKFVFDQHDLFPELVRVKFHNRFLGAVAGLAHRMSLRTANLVIATNESQQNGILDGRPRPATDVILVRNGLPRSWLEREMQYRRGPLNDPRLLYVGVLESQDGADWLPDILSLLVEEHGLSGAHLTIVGGGSRLKTLKRQVDQRGLGRRVHLTGAIAHEHALAAICAADICLDVAPCTEFNHRSTMVKVIEYLTLRKPVVSFPLQETIRLGGDAIAYADCDNLANFAERVAWLAKSDEARMDLVRRTEPVARRLVWEASAAVLVDGYGSLGRSIN